MFDLRDALAAYVVRYPAESDVVGLFSEFLGSAPQVFERSHAIGHFTGSAWLLNRAGTHAVLMLHRKLNRWLQPGGHADGQTDLAQVALREAEEETGLTELRVLPEILDLDRHWIPERGQGTKHEPGHWHYDVRFVVKAGADENLRINSESKELRWIALSEIAEREDLDPSVRRMVGKC